MCVIRQFSLDLHPKNIDIVLIDRHYKLWILPRNKPIILSGKPQT